MLEAVPQSPPAQQLRAQQQTSLDSRQNRGPASVPARPPRYTPIEMQVIEPPGDDMRGAARPESLNV
jgi:hypothetical protein